MELNDFAGARVFSVEGASEILDVFQAHGHYEVRIARPPPTKKILTLYQLDTARVYCAGTSEEMLGDLDWKKRGLVMDTKLYPTIVSSSHDIPGQHKLTNL